MGEGVRWSLRRPYQFWHRVIRSVSSAGSRQHDVVERSRAHRSGVLVPLRRNCSSSQMNPTHSFIDQLHLSSCCGIGGMPGVPGTCPCTESTELTQLVQGSAHVETPHVRAMLQTKHPQAVMICQNFHCHPQACNDNECIHGRHALTIIQ